MVYCLSHCYSLCLHPCPLQSIFLTFLKMQTSSYYSFAQSLPTSLNRIKYELLTIIYKALYGLTPSYLINIHVYHSPTCSLCWPPCCYSNMSSMFLIRAFLFGVLFPRNSLFFFFWLLWVFVAAAFSSCSEWGLLSLLCKGFSLR